MIFIHETFRFFIHLLNKISPRYTVIVRVLILILSLTYHYIRVLNERYKQGTITYIIKHRLSPAFVIFLIMEFIVFVSLF